MSFVCILVTASNAIEVVYTGDRAAGRVENDKDVEPRLFVILNQITIDLLGAPN